MKIHYTAGLLALSLAACDSKKSSKTHLSNPAPAPATAPASAEVATPPSETPTASSSSSAPSSSTESPGAKGTPTPTPIDEPAPNTPSNGRDKSKGRLSMLEGAWHTECASIGNGLSATTTYSYKDGTETLKTETFSGSSCQDAFMTTVQKNIVVVGQELEGTQNTYHFVRTLGRTEATPFTDSAIKSLKGDSVTTNSEWSVGQAKDISNSDDIGRVERLLVKFDGDKLSFGKLDEQGTPQFESSMSKLAQFE